MTPTPAKKTAAKKAATPAKKAAVGRTPRTPRAQAALEDAAVAAAGAGRGTRAATRTATDGAATRTARRPSARTAASTGVPQPVVEPTEVLGRAPSPQGDGSPAADPAAGDQPNAEGVVEQADVTWRGRVIRVRLPTIEQMTMYRRLARTFQELGERATQPGAEPMDMDEATRHYDRAVKLITSIMVNPADIEWLEDEMLEGRVRLPDAAELMREAIGKLGEKNATAANREERRAAAKRARLAD